MMAFRMPLSGFVSVAENVAMVNGQENGDYKIIRDCKVGDEIGQELNTIDAVEVGEYPKAINAESLFDYFAFGRHCQVEGQTDLYKAEEEGENE